MYVIDASVAVKWLLQDEPQSETALAVLEDFANDRIALLAPAHLEYEVANAIRSAVRRGRLEPSAGLRALQFFLALAVPTVSGDVLLLNALTTALELDCALYDALYLTLADHAERPLVHADNRLRNTLAGGFPLEVWIDDYRSPEKRSTG